MTKAQTGRTQYRGVLTRARLLDAALQTLYARGYAACSLPELCRCAGVSRGAQQHHFPTKAELFAAAIEQLMKRRHEEVRAAMRRADGASVDAFVDHLWTIYSSASFYAWLELANAARTDPELRDQLVQVNDRFYEEARNTIAEFLGVPEDAPVLIVAARFVTSVMDGVAVNRILDDDDQMSQATLDIFKTTLRGMKESIDAS